VTTDEFEQLRPRAFGIAYRMLGSVSDAEDVVQDGLMRLYRASAAGEQIDSPPAYLATVVTRLAIDQLRSARARRETYVGEWLPEPLLTTGEEGDPARHAEMADSLSLAFLVVLESLSPEQRAVFLLRDVFDYPYERVAEIVGKSEPATRQLAVRARRHVEEHRPRYAASQREQEELARRFLAAAQEGDVAALETFLAEDVVVHGDGGGKAPALARPIHGRARVARTLAAWSKAGRKFGVTDFRAVEVNGQPGLLTLDRDGNPVSCMAFEIGDGFIRGIRSIVNPDKLRHLAADA
jgi:RNA polymerase sigma-70 factor (TIGR02957 family)